MGPCDAESAPCYPAPGEGLDQKMKEAVAREDVRTSATLFFEIFAGSGQLTLSMQAAGFWVLPQMTVQPEAPTSPASSRWKR